MLCRRLTNSLASMTGDGPARRRRGTRRDILIGAVNGTAPARSICAPRRGTPEANEEGQKPSGFKSVRFEHQCRKQMSKTA